jgi:hypothetical protein
MQLFSIIWLQLCSLAVFGNVNNEIASPFSYSNVYHDSLLLKQRISLTTFVNDPIVTSDTPSCIIPFNRAGNLILIKAKADSIEGNFILDTGAPGLILNMTYFRNYPQTGEAEGESGGITGAVGAPSPTMLS